MIANSVTIWRCAFYTPGSDLFMQDDVDSAIVRRVQRGDKKAFNLLVSKYQHRVLALVARYIYDPMEREDVAQESFIKAYRAIGNFRGESAFYTWLYRISVNTAKNHLSKSARMPPKQDIDLNDEEAIEPHASLADFNTPEASLMNDELAKAIQDAMSNLPEHLREAIMLREVEGMSYEDISVVMSCPIGTVRSRISRARDAIDLAMRPYVENSSLSRQ